jgi:hypothetical protein
MSRIYLVCQNNYYGTLGLVLDRTAVRTGFRSPSESPNASDDLVPMIRQLPFQSIDSIEFIIQ